MGDALVAWVGLSLCQGIGGVKLRRLLEHFGDAKTILGTSSDELQTVKGVTESIAHNIHAIDLNQLATDIHRWQEQGIHILTWDSTDYPQSFLKLPDAPPTIFALGNVDIWKKPTAYAIVGTRTPYPKKRTETLLLSVEMAEKGHLVVSGLAEGIDAAAHLGTFTVVTGRTVAVLGSGILNVYPHHHKALSQAILERDGAILCEVSPNSVVSDWGLVGRNRLIVALSQALIVMQTETDGGAMHAVKFAKRQNKAIYADNNIASGNRAILADGGHDLATLML
ncbi:MAG: DNA-processing protein DprA [bacterium]|nr:DNA-processing protein DprA [bacterium]